MACRPAQAVAVSILSLIGVPVFYRMAPVLSGSAPITHRNQSWPNAPFRDRYLQLAICAALVSLGCEHVLAFIWRRPELPSIGV